MDMPQPRRLSGTQWQRSMTRSRSALQLRHNVSGWAHWRPLPRVTGSSPGWRRLAQHTPRSATGGECAAPPALAASGYLLLMLSAAAAATAAAAALGCCCSATDWLLQAAGVHVSMMCGAVRARSPCPLPWQVRGALTRSLGSDAIRGGTGGIYLLARLPTPRGVDAVCAHIVPPAERVS